MRGLRARLGVFALACAVSGAAAAEASAAKVLIYTGTVAHRHSEAISGGIGPMRDALYRGGHRKLRGRTATATAWQSGSASTRTRTRVIFTDANLGRV